MEERGSLKIEMDNWIVENFIWSAHRSHITVGRGIYYPRQTIPLSSSSAKQQQQPQNGLAQDYYNNKPTTVVYMDLSIRSSSWSHRMCINYVPFYDIHFLLLMLRLFLPGSAVCLSEAWKIVMTWALRCTALGLDDWQILHEDVPPNIHSE